MDVGSQGALEWFDAVRHLRKKAFLPSVGSACRVEDSLLVSRGIGSTYLAYAGVTSASEVTWLAFDKRVKHVLLMTDGMHPAGSYIEMCWHI